jgi:hypothetical protein
MKKLFYSLLIAGAVFATGCEKVNVKADQVAEAPVAATEVLIKITGVPANTPIFERIYMVGNLVGWDISKGKEMRRYPDGSYGLRVPLADLPSGTTEFKFAREKSWDKVEKKKNPTTGACEEIPNRTILKASDGGKTIEISINWWRDFTPGC